jgi:vacuolar-type H+-ATPase subunit D/Vma8
MTKLQKTKTSIKEIKTKLKIKKIRTTILKQKRERINVCFICHEREKKEKKTNNVGGNSTTTSRHGPFCVAKGIVAHSER